MQPCFCLYLPLRFSTLAVLVLINVSAGAYDRHMPSMCMPLALHQPFALFKQAFLSQHTSVNRITSFLIFLHTKKPYHI